MHKYKIFTFMNLTYIFYNANNKVGQMTQLLPLKLEITTKSI